MVGQDRFFLRPIEPQPPTLVDRTPSLRAQNTQDHHQGRKLSRVLPTTPSVSITCGNAALGATAIAAVSVTRAMQCQDTCLAAAAVPNLPDAQLVSAQSSVALGIDD